MFWGNKRVLLTGGYGFLGDVVYNKLINKCDEVIRFHSNEYDLTKEIEVRKLFDEKKDIDVVIHLAADVGGIEYNRKYPGSILYNNLMMNTLLQHYSYVNNVKKFVGVGSVCAYPKFTEIPFKEENLWDGYPEETNASYGISKKVMLEQSKSYNKQYNFKSIHLLMINLYGPNDDFDLENSHVIPALIRKFTEAKTNNKEKVIAWGDGSPTREFMYVEDAARGILLATEKYDKPEPINLGSGMEISIKELTNLIRDLVGFKGEIVWDKSKPNGQPRRCLDVSRAKREFNFEANINFESGLRKTIKWYKNSIRGIKI